MNLFQECTTDEIIEKIKNADTTQKGGRNN